jgi:hypothetical protein
MHTISVGITILFRLHLLSQSPEAHSSSCSPRRLFKELKSVISPKQTRRRSSSRCRSRNRVQALSSPRNASSQTKSLRNDIGNGTCEPAPDSSNVGNAVVPSYGTSYSSDGHLCRTRFAHTTRVQSRGGRDGGGREHHGGKNLHIEAEVRMNLREY